MPSGPVPPPTGCSPKGRSTVGKRGTIFRLGLGFLLAQPPLTKRPVQCGTHSPCSAATPSPPSASAPAPRRPGCGSRGYCPLAEPSPSPCRGRGVPPSPVPSRPVPRSPRRAALPLPPLLKWQLPLICHIPWLGSPSLRLLPRPCSPAPLAKIEKGQHLSILAERLGGDPAFLPPLPLLRQCHWIGAERDPDGMWRERTPSCFLQRKTPGRSQPFRAPYLRSQQTAGVGIQHP